MEFEEILQNLHKTYEDFVYHYYHQPNAILINHTVFRTLMTFDRFREIGTVTKDGFMIMGLKVYETLDTDVFIKVMLIK